MPHIFGKYEKADESEKQAVVDFFENIPCKNKEKYNCDSEKHKIIYHSENREKG